MSNVEAWFKAFRLRTLPLSMSSVILGSLLAVHEGVFHGAILAGTLLTTLFLQILSNLANDYGDAVNGVDNEHRAGPARAVQSGAISRGAMGRAIIFCALLAFFSGIWLLLSASKHMEQSVILVFFAIGLLAIAAAVKYTVGKNPYGYQGFGDPAVFLFFGITGVAGTFYLHTGSIDWPQLLPASALGLLATGVLNLNNMRDMESDSISGKRSIVVMMGFEKARIYHSILVIGALAITVVYTIMYYHSAYQFLFLAAAPILIQNVYVVNTTSRSSDLDKELKKLAFATFIFSLTLGLGLIY